MSVSPYVSTIQPGGKFSFFVVFPVSVFLYSDTSNAGR